MMMMAINPSILNKKLSTIDTNDLHHDEEKERKKVAKKITESLESTESTNDSIYSDSNTHTRMNHIHFIKDNKKKTS